MADGERGNPIMKRLAGGKRREGHSTPLSLACSFAFFPQDGRSEAASSARGPRRKKLSTRPELQQGFRATYDNSWGATHYHDLPVGKRMDFLNCLLFYFVVNKYFCVAYVSHP